MSEFQNEVTYKLPIITAQLNTESVDGADDDDETGRNNLKERKKVKKTSVIFFPFCFVYKW